jgi:hypothetical protein
MAKRIYPTHWSQWIGKFAINCGNNLAPPTVVYISGVRHSCLIARKVNTGIIGFTKPRQLVEFSPRLFIRLEAAWLLRSARDTIAHQTKRLLSGE